MQWPKAIKLVYKGSYWCPLNWHLPAVPMEPWGQLGALFREQEGATQVQPKGSDHFLEHLL